MLSRFHLIPERHGETDRQTDGQTGRIAISISRVSVLTRGKNYSLLWHHLYVGASRYHYCRNERLRPNLQVALLSQRGRAMLRVCQ